MLKGLYVITDDLLTPKHKVLDMLKVALENGAKIVQLRDKSSSDKDILSMSRFIQELCESYGALFVLNDKVDIAISMQASGLHVGKSDHHRIDEIRQNFKGVLGVSCYGDVGFAKKMEEIGVDYVAFGSFFASPTKPSSNIVPLEILHQAKVQLRIPICAIGGINATNAHDVVAQGVDSIALISAIWQGDVAKNTTFYTNLFTKESQ